MRQRPATLSTTSISATKRSASFLIFIFSEERSVFQAGRSASDLGPRAKVFRSVREGVFQGALGGVGVGVWWGVSGQDGVRDWCCGRDGRYKQTHAHL